MACSTSEKLSPLKGNIQCTDNGGRLNNSNSRPTPVIGDFGS